MIAIRRPVSLIAGRNTARIERTAPPGSGHSPEHMVMKLTRAIEAVVFAEVTMFGGMGMAGNGNPGLTGIQRTVGI